MKKSLEEACAKAKELSLLHKDHKVYVLDKPRQKPRVHLSEFCVKESILEGWYGVARFLNGEEIR